MAINKDKSSFGSPSRLEKDKKSGLDPDTQGMTGTGPTDGGSSGRTYSRKGIAEGMKRLSKQGGLTPERIEEARGRASGVGVSDELFDKYMEREGLGKPEKPFGTGFGGSSGFGKAQPLDDRKQEGLGKPEKPFGSGLGKAQPLDDRKSLFFKREARRALKKGYGNVAQDLYGQGIKAKMTEPTIMTKDYRDQQLRQREILAQTAREEDDFMSKMRKKLLAESRGSKGSKGSRGSRGSGGTA